MTSISSTSACPSYNVEDTAGQWTIPLIDTSFSSGFSSYIYRGPVINAGSRITLGSQGCLEVTQTHSDSNLSIPGFIRRLDPSSPVYPGSYLLDQNQDMSGFRTELVMNHLKGLIKGWFRLDHRVHAIDHVSAPSDVRSKSGD